MTRLRSNKLAIWITVALFVAQIGAPFGLRASFQTSDGEMVVICTAAGVIKVPASELGLGTEQPAESHYTDCCLFCPTSLASNNDSAPLLSSELTFHTTEKSIVWPQTIIVESRSPSALAWTSRAPPHFS